MAVDSSQIALALGDSNLEVKNQRTPSSEVKACDCELRAQIPTDAYVDITPQKDGGITKYIKVEGHGYDRPVNGDTVSIRYEGRLADGTLFDTSAEETFAFTIGSGSHLKMFDIAVMSMRCGEKAVFQVHWNHAYGQKGSPPEVPPNTSLKIDVELIDYKGEDISEDKDGSIYRSRLAKGEGFGSPNDGATCEIRIVGRLGDRVFEDRVVRFQLGEGSEVGIVEGVEIALKQFSRGEKARLKVKSGLAYGVEGCPSHSIPPNSDLVYEVELRSSIRVKEFFDMTLEEKFEQSVIDKDKGNRYYKAGKMKLALRCYTKVVEYLQFEDLLEGSAREKRTSLLLAAYLNQAACLLKLDSYRDAAEACSLALTMDPKCEKALYRRGQANHGLQNFEEAMKDFRAVLNIDPDNRTARFQLSISERLLWDCRQKEKKTYREMFKKISEKVTAASYHCGCAKPEEGTSAVETQDDPECTADEAVSDASSDIDPQTVAETKDAQGDASVEKVPKADSTVAVDPETPAETRDVPGDPAAAKNVSKATSAAAVDPQASVGASDAPKDAAAELAPNVISDAAAA